MDVLRWHVDMGADWVLEDVPQDRFAETDHQARAHAQARALQAGQPNASQAKTRQASQTTAQRPDHPYPGSSGQSVPSRPVAPPSPLDAAPPRPMADPTIPGLGVETARELATRARSLEELEQAVRSFDGCNLKRTAKNTVFADGHSSARLMFIGEAPGRDEDMQGLPFIGRSGQLLNRMLKAIELDRQSAYIANVLYWRPPGNRTPTPEETETCKPFIQRQIELVNPDVLVFLGAASSKALLGTTDGIRRLRGRWMTYALPDRDIKAIATYHPAYLLRQPLEKRLSWQDFLAIKAALSAS